MQSCRRYITTTGAGVLLLLLCLTLGCSKKESLSPPLLPPPLPPLATPTPTPFIPRRIYDTARLFNGITLKSSLEATPVESTSLHLGGQTDSYTLQLDLHLKVPEPATTTTDLLAATPELGSLLPNLEQLLTNATASPDFATLFANKEKNIRANLSTLQRLLPLDTLYDCQTILNLENPVTSRQALLIQALMNVNADGSDGDRNLNADNHSAFFQPQTNYRWPKATTHPNPCLEDAKAKLALIEGKLLAQPLSEADKLHLEAQRSETKETLKELKDLSFLVGTADPFIVLPSFMFKSTEGHPEIGDYAIVITHNTLYPAILGDKGPNYKMGEASLRICKEIDNKSTADARPIDHPTVAYLIFPGTAEKPFSTPDYKHWSERCHALWKEFGGSDCAAWQEWDSLEKPWPTPTPSPSPTPSPTPSPSSTTSPSPSTTSGTNAAASPTPDLTNALPNPTP